MSKSKKSKEKKISRNYARNYPIVSNTFQSNLDSMRHVYNNINQVNDEEENKDDKQ